MKKRPAVIKSVLSSIVENGYDSMGRRYMQKVTINGTVTRHERYLYRGYLQIAALDILHGGKQKHALFWDPTEPLATRPLVLLSSDGNRYTYAHDLTKNVTELIDEQGNIAATYDYDPFGKVTTAGPAAHLNPIQWSSEHYDPELALVYYNYRHYNPADGRWINRDPIAERGGFNLYGFAGNNPEGYFDGLGLSAVSPENLASCIYITPHAKLKDTFGAGWSIYPWFFAHRLVVKHSFIINIRAHWKPGNSYAKDSRCTCRMVRDEYVKAQYPYAIYASAKVITDGDENPVIYNMSGHEQITLYGRFQKDEISMANILAGKEMLGTISPGIADFSIKGRFLKKYNEVEVMAYVENPGKSPITIYKQIYSYKYSDSDVPWFRSYRWFKLPAQID